MTESITLEAWIYVYDWCGNRRVFQKGSGDNQYFLLVHAGIFEIGLRGTSIGDLGALPPSTNVWHHVAGVYNFDQSIAQLFFDGNKVAEKENVTGNLQTSLDPLYIGTKYPGAPYGDYFYGMIDEVRVWNIARTQPEIEMYMDRELQRTEPGLVGYWSFNEGSGPITYDITSNNNDGYLNGDVLWVKSNAPLSNWIIADPQSGICYVDSTINILISVNAVDLDLGDYYTSIIVSSNDPQNSNLIIPVLLKVTSSLGIDDQIAGNIPKKFSLSYNYPNPFNPVTMINYQLPITNYVDLSIYNLLGQKVKTLVSEKQNAGYHQVEWDASGFASGIYYYRIEADEFQDVKKMILIK
jgi:hypothetical protein